MTWIKPSFFVYKSNVDGDLFIQDEYHELHHFAEIRMMHSCFCRLQKWNFANLAAPFWRWYWNQNSGASIMVGGKRIELKPDRVLLIPPHTAFASGVSRPVAQLYMHFALGLDRVNVPGIVFAHTPDLAERRQIKRLVHVLQHQKPDSALEISFLSQALVHIALAAVPAPSWGGRFPDSRIDKALRSIKAAMPGTVSNIQLAREAGINVNAFTKLFLKATGLTPRQYLIHLRVEEACRLLQRGTAGIDEVAEQTGFCDRFHFSRMFTRCLGVTPASFRRRSAISG